MFHRAWLYVKRNWKRSLILILILTVLLSALAVVFPTWRASMQAQEDLAASLGENFHVEWGISQLTHPHLYEEYLSEDGNFTLYRYIGEDRMTTQVLEEILAIDGITDYTRTYSWWLWCPDLDVKDGLYSTYYSDPDNRTIFSEYDNYDYDIGKNEVLVWGLNHSQMHEFFERGSIELTEGRHINPDDRGKVVISSYLAEQNGFALGDTFTAHQMQITLQGVGTMEDILGTYTLEIVGLFDVLGETTDIMHGLESDIIENQMFCDIHTLSLIDAANNAYMGSEAPAENIISEPLRFYVEDPAQLQSIMEQVRAIDTIDMSVFDIDIANPSYSASIQPLRAMRGMMTAFLCVIVFAVLLILRFVLKLWLQGRKKEFGILLSLGVTKKQVLGQVLLEILLIFSVAFAASSFITLATIDKTGNFMYSLTANDPRDADAQQYEKTTNIWGSEYDYSDPFISVPDYSPDELTPEMHITDFLLFVAIGGAVTVLVALWCCIPILNQRPRKILSNL